MVSKDFLYKLLTDFIENKFDAKTFSEKFSDTYYLDIDEDELTANEKSCFQEILLILERFSPFKEDLVKYNYYIDETVMKGKLEEILMELRK